MKSFLHWSFFAFFTCISLTLLLPVSVGIFVISLMDYRKFGSLFEFLFSVEEEFEIFRDYIHKKIEGI